MARRSTIRASDADRDSVIERLRTASAEGRLASHELEHRVSAALKAKTYGELDATVSDLPGVPGHRRRPRSGPGRAVAVVRAHPALILVAIPVAAIVAAAVVTIAVLMAMIAVLALLLGNRRMMYRGPWMYRRHVHRGGPGYLPWV